MSRSPVNPDEVRALARTLEERGLEYAFIGGIAMNTWGLPRATYDFDAVVVLSEERQGPLLRSLRELGYVVDEIYERGYRDVMAGMPVIHVTLPAEQTFVRVDLVIAETEFLRSLMARKVPVDSGTGQILVCRPADLILLKLLAWRWKDRADIENVFTIQGNPEPEHLRHWARVLGVEGRLDEALAQL